MHGLIIATAAMCGLVAASNYLVQFAINDWLTWAAFTYPVTFLVTDLTNRAHGPGPTRRVVYVGFALAVVLSIWLATPRIALASGGAFLVAQLVDVGVFHRLRRRAWWQAPLASSGIASTVDTALFFSVAFVGTDVPWVTLAVGDLAVKFALAAAMLVPFGLLLHRVSSWTAPARS